MVVPRSMWKSLRTINLIEHRNGEFKRRRKTQGFFSSEDSELLLRYGLLATGQNKMRKIDSWRQLPKLVTNFVKAG